MTVTAIPTTDEKAEPKPKKSKKLVLIIVLVALLGGGFGAYKFFLAAPKDEAPVPGEVVALEPIQVNLSDGHYLKLGIALQGVEGAHEIDGTKALDAAIRIFSNRDLSEVISSDGREKLRKELEEQLDELYHHEVLAVYFVDYVTQ